MIKEVKGIQYQSMFAGYFMICKVFSSTLYNLIVPKPCKMDVIYTCNIGGNNQGLENTLTLSKPELNPDFVTLIWALKT